MAKPFESEKFSGRIFDVRQDPKERGLLHRKGPTEVDSSGFQDSVRLGNISNRPLMEILEHFDKKLSDLRDIIDSRRMMEASKRRRAFNGQES